MLDIFLCSLQVWFLTERVYTINLTIAWRRSREISKNISIACLRSCRGHSQCNDGVRTSREFQARLYHTSEFIGISNDMVARRNHHICLRVLRLYSPAHISNARRSIAATWLQQDVLLVYLRLLLTDQGGILLVCNHPNIFYRAYILKPVEGKLQ